MISIYYDQEFGGGTAPYSYTLSSSNPCVTFSQNSGSAAQRLQFEATYDNEACLATSIITVAGSDANGCEFSFVIAPDNICDSLSVNPISFTPPYTFTVDASRPGCTQGLTFNWIFNEDVFSVDQRFDSAFTSEIRLTPNPNVSGNISTTNIQAVVTDCYGCEETVNYVFTFCQPQVQDFPTELICIDTNSNYTYQRQNLSIPQVLGCTGIEIDWATLQYSAPTGVVVSNNGNGTVNIFADPSIVPETFTITYSVATTDGIRSTIGNISVTLVPCQKTRTIFIANDVFQIPCDSSPGETLTINIEDLVVTSPGTVVDWSTWAVLSDPAYTSPSITLTTDINGDHVINYVIPDPAVTEVFAWTVCDTEANCADAAIYTVLECTTGPTANDDSVCISCGTSAIIDVQANDIEVAGPIVAGSTTIVTPPTLGTVTVLSDGTINYTAPAGTLGVDTFTYTVEDVLGNVSNEATVTVEMICAGFDSNVSVCQQ